MDRLSDRIMTRRSFLGASAIALGGIAAFRLVGSAPASAAQRFAVVHSPAEWRKLLTPAQYAVLREAATEPAGSSPLDHEKRRGRFLCAGCALPLFSSATKFDSGTGWPSFYAPFRGAVATSTDLSAIIPRTEVHCRRCGGHLGHVFNDGPPPTGKRYCMNGTALAFKAG
jgi:peptide-methionine (R)-S-oxide reductase